MREIPAEHLFSDWQQPVEDSSGLSGQTCLGCRFQLMQSLKSEHKHSLQIMTLLYRWEETSLLS